MLQFLDHVENGTGRRCSRPSTPHLKARAARQGGRLSDLITGAARPSMQEWLKRTEGVKPIQARESPAQVIIHKLRDGLSDLS
jgi:hypothetical protein